MNGVIDKLAAVLDSNRLILGDHIGARYRADYSGLPPQKPVAVVRPTDTEELIKILGICNEEGQPIVTQGGMTGLAGAATPDKDEIVLSLELLSGVEEVDADAMTMTVLSGTPLQEAQEKARDAGFYLPLDLGARGSCTIGGNLATNAGGNQVVRYGMMRDLVLGLEAVLADGTVISSLSKVIKNNTGYDLKQLFIGSEGTLGVITRAVLSLQPLFPGIYTALCAASDFKNVIAFFKWAQSHLPGGVCAFEVMWSDYYRYIVSQLSHLNDPFRSTHEIYLIIQYQGPDQPLIYEMFEQMLLSGLEQKMLDDVLVAQSSREADIFWQIRDGIGEVINRIAPSIAFDISIPLGEMHNFITDIKRELRQDFPETEQMFFGHIGDGNLHLTVRLSDMAEKGQVSERVYKKIGKYRGAISAEHGIGRIKKNYLSYSRSEQEINLMRTLKRALDPNQILNRGRIF